MLFWLTSSRNQMLALAQVLKLKALSFSKDMVFLFMFKYSAWLWVAWLVRNHENQPWAWEGFAENRNVPGVSTYSAAGSTNASRHPGPSIRFRLVWGTSLLGGGPLREEKIAGNLQWMDCPVWEQAWFCTDSKQRRAPCLQTGVTWSWQLPWLQLLGVKF